MEHSKAEEEEKGSNNHPVSACKLIRISIAFGGVVQKNATVKDNHNCTLSNTIAALLHTFWGWSGIPACGI